MVWDNRELIETSDFPSAVYEVLKYLVSEKSFEDSVVFERPMIRHKKNIESSLEQLEWATKNRKFWFLGPIDWVRFECKSGALRGVLFIGKNVMVFKTLENMSEAEKLLSLLKQQGMEVDFQEVNTFTAEISVWDNKPFSPQNTRLFLEKLEKQMKRRKPRPPR